MRRIVDDHSRNSAARDILLAHPTSVTVVAAKKGVGVVVSCRPRESTKIEDSETVLVSFRTLQSMSSPGTKITLRLRLIHHPYPISLFVVILCIMMFDTFSMAAAKIKCRATTKSRVISSYKVVQNLVLTTEETVILISVGFPCINVWFFIQKLYLLLLNPSAAFYCDCRCY